MFIIAGVGQLIVFFLVWRLFLWATGVVKGSMPSSLWTDLFANLILAIILLILLHHVHNFWWLTALVGAFVGIFSVQVKQNPTK